MHENAEQYHSIFVTSRRIDNVEFLVASFILFYLYFIFTCKIIYHSSFG